MTGARFALGHEMRSDLPDEDLLDSLIVLQVALARMTAVMYGQDAFEAGFLERMVSLVSLAKGAQRPSAVAEKMSKYVDLAHQIDGYFESAHYQEQLWGMGPLLRSRLATGDQKVKKSIGLQATAVALRTDVTRLRVQLNETFAARRTMKTRSTSKVCAQILGLACFASDFEELVGIMQYVFTDTLLLQVGGARVQKVIKLRAELGDLLVQPPVKNALEGQKFPVDNSRIPPGSDWPRMFTPEIQRRIFQLKLNELRTQSRTQFVREVRPVLAREFGLRGAFTFARLNAMLLAHVESRPVLKDEHKLSWKFA